MSLKVSHEDWQQNPLQRKTPSLAPNQAEALNEENYPIADEKGNFVASLKIFPLLSPCL
jgi:hypothetical protein